MLASEFHIKKESEIKRAYKFGKILRQPWYTVYIFNRNEETSPRFAFVISTKISKLATQRNRIRRVINDTIRYNLQSIPKGLDMVFVVKPEISTILADVIQKELTAFIEKTFGKKVS